MNRRQYCPAAMPTTPVEVGHAATAPPSFTSWAEFGPWNNEPAPPTAISTTYMPTMAASRRLVTDDRLGVRHRHPPARSLAVLPPRLLHARRALVADGRRDHALGADGSIAPGAVDARGHRGMPVAVLGRPARAAWRAALPWAPCYGPGRATRGCGTRARGDRRAPWRPSGAAPARGGPAGRAPPPRARRGRSDAGRRRCSARRGADDRSTVPCASPTCSTPGTAAATSSMRVMVCSSVPSSTRCRTARAAWIRVAKITTVMASPTAASARGMPAITPSAEPTTASDVRPSVRACRPSATIAVDPIRTADADPVGGDRLVAERPDDAGREDPAHVIDGLRVDQALDRLGGGHDRGDEDHRDDDDAGEVLRAVVAIRVPACGRLPGQPERDQQRDRGEGVGEVVDRVREQRHRTGSAHDQQLE